MRAERLDPGHSSILRLTTIGETAVEVGDARLDSRTPIPLVATVYLARAAGRRVPRDELAELLWPDADADARRNRLRTLLHRMRLAGVPLVATAQDVSMPGVTVAADFRRFADPGWVIRAQALARLPIVLPLPGQWAAPLERWLEDTRSTIAREVARGLVEAMRIARAGGDWPAVERCAAACRELDALNEEAHLSLAEALYLTASRERALEVLDEYAAQLGEGREPPLPVRMLRERIARAERAGSVTVEATMPLVGRADVRRQLVDAVHDAARGRGGARIVRGEAGMGKTRLLAEVEREVVLRGGSVVTVRCEPADLQRPLSLLFHLVPALLELPGAIGSDSSTLEALRDLPANPSAADLTPAEGAVRRSRVEVALLDLLDAVSEERALTVLVDDAQWMDDGLRRLWETLLPWSRSRAVLWIFACRVDGDAPVRLPLGESPPQIALGPLEASEASELVARCLRHLGVEGSADIHHRLPRAAGGNPFVLMELARHYTTARTMDELPGSVSTLIAERLDRLSRPAIRVLQAAGLLGSHASLARLDAVLALPRTDFVESVAELAAAGIADGAAGELRAHSLWADAAVARLPHVVACVLHRHAAEGFEAELAETPTMPLLWECARHWQAAGDAERAHAALLRGAEHLAANGYFGDAAAVYAQALEGSDAARQLQLMERRILLLQLAGHWQTVLEAIDAYRQLAAALDPTYTGHDDLELQRQLAVVYCTGDVRGAAEAALACVRSTRASPSHRIAAARECVKLGEVVGRWDLVAAAAEIASTIPAADEQDRVNARVVAMFHDMVLGDRSRAADVAIAWIRDATDHGGARQMRRALYSSVEPLLIAGRIDDAWAAAHELLALNIRQGSIDHMKEAYDLLMTLSLEFEEPQRARVWLGRLRELVEIATLDDPMMRDVFVPMYEAQLLVMEGRGADALAVAPALDACRSIGGTRWQARFHAVHLGARLLEGDMSGASEVARGMRGAFEGPDRWLDWPAAIYARWLREDAGEAQAADFARHYVGRVRRELYPPPAELRLLLESEAAYAGPDTAARRVTGQTPA